MDFDLLQPPEFDQRPKNTPLIIGRLEIQPLVNPRGCINYPKRTPAYLKLMEFRKNILHPRLKDVIIPSAATQQPRGTHQLINELN